MEDNIGNQPNESCLAAVLLTHAHDGGEEERSMGNRLEHLKCLDVPGWRRYDAGETAKFLERVRKTAKERRAVGIFKSMLIFRRHLAPLDIYCYLKARFGEPNGFLTRLASKKTSDNLFHWDFNLKAANEDIQICGTNREVHLALSEALADEDWPILVARMKDDFRRVAHAKSAVFKTLEHWVIFPNKYVQVAQLCAELHGGLSAYLKRPAFTKASRITPARFQNTVTNEPKKRRELVKGVTKLFREGLELSLLTPVLAEAFINMAILLLCKREIRESSRQLEAFIRSQIDVKIMDLPYKCSGFVKRIDSTSPEFKAFKAVMDNRNDTIHGNVNPEREKVEEVFFEGKRPLFREPGDHVLKYFQALERQIDPETVIKNYEDVHSFLVSIGECLDSKTKSGFWKVMETTYPGYDLDRKILGVLLPETVRSAYPAPAHYDDELQVNWSTTGSNA